jgi:hypothetical protein
VDPGRHITGRAVDLASGPEIRDTMRMAAVGDPATGNRELVRTASTATRSSNVS